MIPTKKIKLNGKEYPFHFGTGASYLLGIKLELEDVKLKELDLLLAEAELKEIPVFIWCGLLSGASKAGRDTEKVISIEQIRESLIKDPYALDVAIDIMNDVKEEYAEDVEGNVKKTKSKK